RARADHRVAADLKAGDDYRGGADRGAATVRAPAHGPVGRVLQRSIRVRRARSKIVREYDLRPDEDAVFDGQSLEERGVVLDLAAIADGDAGSDVGALADVALGADPRALANLCEVPHARGGPDARVGS